MPLMDSYKFLHFFYDLSNLWHFIPLQCTFLFTSRGGLSQNVKRLWEGKDLHCFQLNLQKNPTVGSADMGRIKLSRLRFHQKVQRGRAREPLAPGLCPAVSARPWVQDRGSKRVVGSGLLTMPAQQGRNSMHTAYGWSRQILMVWDTH